MARETDVDVHVINAKHPEDDNMFHDVVVNGEVGFTQGVSRSKQPIEIAVDDVNCYAKVVYIPEENGGPMLKHFVKIGISGFLFDPWGIFSEGTQAKDAKHMGKMAWEFRRVDKRCFDNYLKFLMTRNKAWFNLAEREIRSNV